MNNRDSVSARHAGDLLGRLVLCAIAAIQMVPASLQAGTFTNTHQSYYDRVGHTATLLNSGKVMVTGGATLVTIQSTEVYDPASGMWTIVGGMTYPRQYHTATLLPDGRVLAAGGASGGFANTAELFYPASGTWSNTGSMNFGRQSATATLLTNGQVLVAGGDSFYGTSSELYDPVTGIWTRTGDLNDPRASHTATLLPSGQVLVVGSLTGTATTEVYDPNTGKWKYGGSLSVPVRNQTATLLSNGMVLIAGGFASGNQSLTNSQLFDPATGVWTNSGPLNQVRVNHTATLLPGGKVLVAGGYDGNLDPGCISSAELYDTATRTWTPTGSLLTARSEHTANLLPNGLVLVVDGGGANGNLFSAELYLNPVIQSFGQDGSTFNFNWGAIPGFSYQVQYITNPTSANWINLGGAILATNSMMPGSDPLVTSPSQRFYRVIPAH